MTPAAAFGRSSAAPPGPRSPSRPRRPVLAVLLLAAAAGAGLVVPLLGEIGQVALGLGVPSAVGVFLALRSRATAAPAAWRWYAAALLLSGVGAALLPLVTGDTGTSVLGVLPGQLVGAVAVLHLAPRACWRRRRTAALTAGTLFLAATLLALDIAASFVSYDAGNSPFLRIAVHAVPLCGAVSTAAGLLFLAGSEVARRPVAVAMLVGKALASTVSMASLFVWGTGSAVAGSLVWPATLASLTATVVACLRDRPAAAEAGRSSSVPGTTASLLPHTMAFLAGGAALMKSALSSGIDDVQGAIGLVMLAMLVAHQTVMWRTQRRLTGQLQRSESFFRTLVRSSVDPVVILDDRLRLSFASPALWNLLGIAPSRSLRSVIHPDDLPVLSAALRQSGSLDNAVRTARMRHADGGWRLIQCTVRDLRTDPDVGALVVFCRDVTPRTRVQGTGSELLELSLTDPVTGLPNRTALVRRLGAVQRGDAGTHSAALALIGFSGLEGLAPGTADAVLRVLTSRLTRALRGEDWLARGKDGDFVVLVEGSIADAEVVAARLVADVGTLNTPAGPVQLTAVAGVTALPTDVDPGEAMRRCSVALRSARLAGGGAVHRYDDALRMQRDRSDALSTDLDGAIERGELRLVFQPVVDLVLHETVSVEALLRWRHPVFGDVPPVEFVPLAEQSPLIGQLGRWVLHEACAAVAALPGTELAVAVNVSARQVRSGELVADVLAALEASGLPASRLIVEITESVLMDDAHVIDDLNALRQLGVRIAVDDFGTGWSSLAYLVGLPIDALKMDQHFVMGVEEDQQRQALCRAVLQLGASLGLPVIVEGVTSEAELALLRDMGHRFLQGFVFSRPLEAGQLTAGAWRTGGAAIPAVPAPRAEVAGSPPVGAP